MRLMKITVAAIFAFAMALTFSCSSGNGGGDEPSSSSIVGVEPSSSSVETWFCYYPSTEQCFPTILSAACPGGELMNYCPSVGQSSSSHDGELLSSSSEEENGEQSSSSDTGDVGESSSGGSEIDGSSSSDVGLSSSGDVGVSSSGEVAPSSSGGVDVSSSSSVGVSSSSLVVIPSSSSIFVGGLSSSGTPSGNVFVDSRDGKQYEYSIVSSKVWMKQNLNYSRNNTLGFCYGVDILGDNANRDSTSCGSGYGRIYKWSVAMDGMSGAGAQGLCPSGWHIPAYTEWNSSVPVVYAGNYNNNTEYPPLGWKSRGSEGLYWTSTDNSHFAFTQSTGTAYQMNNNAGAADYFSVRCVANATWDCGSETYNPVTSFCSGNNVYARCNNNAYDVSTSGCCGTSTYVLATHFCVGTARYEKCGGQTYDPSTQGCSGTTITYKCGTYYYNPATEFCSSSKVYDKCGGEEYNPSTQACQGGILFPKCGSYQYNPATEFCSGTTVYDKCGGEEYNPSTHACQGGTLFPKCGSVIYNPVTEFCSGNTVYDKCGGVEYNPSTHVCSGGTLAPSCNGAPYNSTTQFCYGGQVIDKCGEATYIPGITECNNGSLVTKPHVFYEDFEGIAAWTVISSGTNVWAVPGTATSYEGLKSAYISNNSGTSNAYTTSATSATNLHKIVTFPEQSESFTLSFYYKGRGESGYDYMTVYLVPTSATISSAAPASTYREGASQYYGETNWSKAIISLSASTYSGKSYFLVFRWQNDGSGGTQPPAAIDNILIE